MIITIIVSKQEKNKEEQTYNLLKINKKYPIILNITTKKKKLTTTKINLVKIFIHQ